MNERTKFNIAEFKKLFLGIHPICEMCGERFSEDLHHKFSQSKQNKKLYGSLIHHPRNLMAVCKGCHSSAPHWTEKEFCECLGIEPRSKYMRNKIDRGAYEIFNRVEMLQGRD